MGKLLDSLTPKLEEFIVKQHIFFVGTAMKEGRVNVSPKGMDTFKVISKNKVIWLNLTGSGNETATHIQESNRMTIMFCSFEGKPLILRLYGKAKAYHPRDTQFHDYLKEFSETTGARQIFELDIDNLFESFDTLYFIHTTRDTNNRIIIESAWYDKNIEIIKPMPLPKDSIDYRYEDMKVNVSGSAVSVKDAFPGEKLKIWEVSHFSPQAAYRFFDTTSAINYLNNEFAFESFKFTIALEWTCRNFSRF